MFDVPILVIIYNRVEFTHDLFIELRKIKPEKLYVAADGAISDDRTDYQHCLEARCVFRPEWPCQMQTLFSDVHNGKSAMLMQALTWFFEKEPEGIVLFDDSLPHPDFFPFCKMMLEKYRDDMRIMHIGGTNMLRKPEKHTDKSYFFSAYPATWGFATWRNRLNDFDLKMHELESTDFSELLSHYTFKKKAQKFWTRRYRLLSKENIDIWEYQYAFHIWKSGGLCVVPAANLVQNRGFRPQKRRLRRLNRPVQTILPILVNDEVEQHVKADKYIFRHYYKKDKLTFLQRWLDENVFNN